MTPDEHFFTHMAKQTCNNMVQFLHRDASLKKYHRFPYMCLNIQVLNTTVKFQPLKHTLSVFCHSRNCVYLLGLNFAVIQLTIFGPRVQKGLLGAFFPLLPFFDLFVKDRLIYFKCMTFQVTSLQKSITSLKYQEEIPRKSIFTIKDSILNFF